MKIIFGPNKKENSDCISYFDESDLNLPIGIEGYSTSLLFFKDIAEKTIDGKTIPQIFEYNNISLWWFIFPTIFPEVQKSINFISKFLDLIEIQLPTEIFLTDFRHFELIKKICKEKQIKFSHSKIGHLKYMQSLKNISYIQKQRFHRIHRTKIQKRIRMHKTKNDSIPKTHNKIIFAIPNTYRRFRFDKKQNKSVKGEYIQAPIIEFLQELNKSIICIDLDYSFKGDFDTLDQRLNDPLSWFPIESLFTFSSEIKIKKFLKKFNNIINNKKFRIFFSYDKINFWNEIDFQKLTFDPYLPTYIELIDSLKAYFKTSKPESVFLPYETGPYALAMIAACKENGIKNIGIQHGLIWENNSDYSHGSFRTLETPSGMLIPDVTLLFGKYSYDVLTKIGYPKSNFQIFGNPEFFNIDESMNKLNTMEIKFKYKIPNNKKIILFATGKSQKHYSSLGGYLDYDEQTLIKLLEEYSNTSNYFIIIKPHPGEYLSFYKQLIEKYSNTNFKIIEGDLFELLSVSDINITIFSTVLMDSIMLGKKTIRIKFPGNTVPIPYDEYGVLVSCTLEKLPYVVDCMFDKQFSTEKLFKNQQQFMKYVYNFPNLDPKNQLRLLLDKKTF